MVKFIGMFMPIMKILATRIDVDVSFDANPAKEVLGIEFIPMEKAVPEMATSLIENGYIPDKRNQKKGCF